MKNNIEALSDELYRAGYDDCFYDRDCDPRATLQWQAVVDKVETIKNNPKQIKIEILHDDHECETCGYIYAEGYHATLPDGHEIILQPIAHCYDSVHWNDSDLYAEILKHLGYVTFDAY